jgi:hypothetical protein
MAAGMSDCAALATNSMSPRAASVPVPRGIGFCTGDEQVNPFLDSAGCDPLLGCGFATPSASEATVRQILFGIKINW